MCGTPCQSLLFTHLVPVQRGAPHARSRGHLGYCGGLESSESWIRHYEPLFISDNLRNVCACPIQIGNRIGSRTSGPVQHGAPNVPAREKGLDADIYTPRKACSLPAIAKEQSLNSLNVHSIYNPRQDPQHVYENCVSQGKR